MRMRRLFGASPERARSSMRRLKMRTVLSLHRSGPSITEAPIGNGQDRNGELALTFLNQVVGQLRLLAAQRQVKSLWRCCLHNRESLSVRSSQYFVWQIQLKIM